MKLIHKYQKGKNFLENHRDKIQRINQITKRKQTGRNFIQANPRQAREQITSQDEYIVNKTADNAHNYNSRRGGRTQRKQDEPYIREEKEKEKEYSKERNLRIKRQKKDEEYFRNHATSPFAIGAFGKGTEDYVPKAFNKTIEYAIGKPIQFLINGMAQNPLGSNGYMPSLQSSDQLNFYKANADEAVNTVNKNVLSWTTPSGIAEHVFPGWVEKLRGSEWGNAVLNALDLYIAPKMIKGTTKVVKDWRPWVPSNSNRYYRIVGKTGDPIGDAIETGTIRGPGKNPNATGDLMKAHDYPMFSKGRTWQGSTSRVDGGKPIVIRSKKDTGPIVWEESTVDFGHKGHEGIYRPNWFGDLNGAPTKYFEYWIPQRFGYMRYNFPKSNNPFGNFMRTGFTVDRGSWMESDLGVTGNRFGKYIGAGGEQTVFEDLGNPNKVLKVYNDTYVKDMEGLKGLVADLNKRNQAPLSEPIGMEGFIVNDLNNHRFLYPVFNQNRLTPLKVSHLEYMNNYFPLLQKELGRYGYKDTGSGHTFTDGTRVISDVKPENIGLNSEGKLRFIDTDFYYK